MMGEDPTELLHLALAEEERFPDLTYDASRYAKVLKRLGAKEELLDVGCGIGIHASIALQSGFSVHGIEPGRAACLAYGLLNGKGPYHGMLTEKYARAHTRAFDVILLSQVLEHICDLDEMLSWLGMMLRNGGIVAVGVPRFRSWLSLLQGKRDMFISPPEHVNFFTGAGLQRLFHRNGFEMVASETLSRIDPKRIQRRLPLRVINAPLARLIAAMIRSTDIGSLGISLRQYFRRLGNE
ncbi:MAG: class I SAM-dependent methyltransferase [Planctomycetes bacterium]|nr:class I SAM-dependent methyltransferase [Planctomycetota bacterium]